MSNKSFSADRLGKVNYVKIRTENPGTACD